MDKEVIKIEDLVSDADSKKNTLSKNKFLKFLTPKNIKIIVLVIIFVIAIIIFMGVGNSEKTSKNSVIDDDNYTSTLEYSETLERKLENVLNKISGAGNVSVMLTLEGSPELVYASDENSKISNNGSSSTSTNSSTPIIIETAGSSNPLILTENLPKVKGVIVVSTGANNVAIKLDILNAVSTLLDISTEKICVLKGI